MSLDLSFDETPDESRDIWGAVEKNDGFYHGNFRPEASYEDDGDRPWEIFEGDCVDILPTTGELAQVIFAEPPYNIGADYGEGEGTDRLSDEAYLAWGER